MHKYYHSLELNYIFLINYFVIFFYFKSYIFFKNLLLQNIFLTQVMYIVIVQQLEKRVFQNHYKYLLLADIPNSKYILESS